MRSLIPTTPALPIGVSRHFRAAACIHPVTSPNKPSSGNAKLTGNVYNTKKESASLYYIYYFDLKGRMISRTALS